MFCFSLLKILFLEMFLSWTFLLSFLDFFFFFFCFLFLSFSVSYFLLPQSLSFSRELLSFVTSFFFAAGIVLLPQDFPLLPWLISFLPWAFLFCRELFSFAVVTLVSRRNYVTKKVGDIFEGFKNFLNQHKLGRYDIEVTLKFPRRSKHLFSKFNIASNL